MCPRDLNTGTGEISPDRGNSCNKSNRNGADASGYSAACSLSAPLPGLYVAVLQERSSAPAPLAAAPCRHSAAGLRGQAGLPFVLSSGRPCNTPFCWEHLRRYRQTAACRAVVLARDAQAFSAHAETSIFYSRIFRHSAAYSLTVGDVIGNCRNVSIVLIGNRSIRGRAKRSDCTGYHA